MVFISNPVDVTLTPAGASSLPAFQAAQRVNTRLSFDQAAAANNIYKNNGLICQRMMCQSMTGCDNCSQHPDWDKVVGFCGPAGTPGLSMDGSWWTLQPADTHQQLLSATEKATGMSPLPTPYNVVGMY